MNQPDFRSNLNAAQQWASELVGNVRPEQLSDPTPCSEFTVAQLIEHLLAVQERITSMASSGTIGDVPSQIALTTDSPGEDFDRRARAGADAWDAWSADDLWSRTVTAPFGTVPGGAAVMMYASENLAHGWDLAVATGQPSEADPQVVAPILAGMKRALPAEPRGAEVGIPFAPVVESAPDAGPTEQLANWAGRSR